MDSVAYESDPRRIPFQSAALQFFPPLGGGGGGGGAHLPEPPHINNFKALSIGHARARSPSIPASTFSSGGTNGTGMCMQLTTRACASR